MPCLHRRLLRGIVLVALCTGTAVVGIAPDAQAHQKDPAAESSDGESPGWGPIIGACLGVLFGGALAVWQIKGMKNRG